MIDQPKPAHRIVLCRGDYCNLGRRADTLYARLRDAVDEANRATPGETPCASLRTANCLSMCAVGPNLVVYPEDDVYHHLDVAALEPIIERYVRCR